MAHRENVEKRYNEGSIFQRVCARGRESILGAVAFGLKHPWTNGYVERLNKTLLDEFYSVAFRKKQYKSIEELQIDLDNFMDYYNHRRTHQGYKLKENGYKTPGQAHLAEILTPDKRN